MNTKKKWVSPQFIVLARGTPEESVLTHCKYIGNVGWSVQPDVYAQTGCDKGDNKNCGNCQSRSGT